MSHSDLKKVVRNYRELRHEDRMRLEKGIGQVRYTITIRRTHKGLAGYEFDSMDGRVGMVVVELVSVTHSQPSSRRLPHQIVTALRGLRRGLPAGKRTQAFFRGLIGLKGVRVVELQAAYRPAPAPVKQEAPIKQEAPVVQEEAVSQIVMPTDDEVPDSWDDE
jgi:hypothetical protein